jgi:polo-like kinase 1
MKHANICEYKHFFEDKTNCYILLELCHNQSMNEMIKRRKSLTEEEARFFMLQIIDAVSYMHEGNVIHRDLKLGNLFLSKHLNIKVGDFGLATRLESSDEKRKTICGTPNYIAPEVINSDKEKRGHSFEVDTWSMGVICFTMIVGKPPYESTDVKSTYRRILANEYSFPEGKVSTHARELISAMLQTDPKMRPTLEALRTHPFFSERIPNSLPHSCTISQPIWDVDEFGELHAIKPTSALDIKAPSSKAVVKKTVGKPLEALDNILPSKSSKNAITSSAAPSTSTPKFNIFSDSCDQVECKPTANTLQSISDGATPVNKLADKMSAFGFDDVKTSPPTESPFHDDSKTAQDRHVPSVDTPKERHSSPDDLNELEVMYDRLNECLSNYERVQNGGAKVEPTSPIDSDMWGAKKWVTRYVDYTSKYGLGFLLNDGNSGVYFNDSTKAVLSTDDDNFIYVERKKGALDSSEPISSYTLADYPVDALKKKVTLLQHFRSYLLEQQKRAEDNGEADSLGKSNDGLVYMKKWIRTKHAMLFRLSDGTVQVRSLKFDLSQSLHIDVSLDFFCHLHQVLFYDLTEVLISSEGKLVTFVDKEKNRFVHTIADVANKQQNDIQRRLKYAKEILSQLISGSKR